MSNQTDVAIIGGGMAGLCMAIALAKLELEVLVVDQSPLEVQHLPAFDGRVSAIALGSKRMLDKLGVWAGIEAHVEPILDIRVSDGASPFFLHYDHEEVGDEPFGWIAENRHTRKALYDVAAQHANITLKQAGIEALSQDVAGCRLSLSDGTEVQARMVIGADGKCSKVRELAGIAVHQVGYKQTALVCTIEHTSPHDGLAQERFLPRGPFAVLPMKSLNASALASCQAHEAPLRALKADSPAGSCADASPTPLAGGAGGGQYHSSLVWVEPQRLAGHYLALDKNELADEIQQRVGGYLGDIAVKGEVFSYPLHLSLAETFHAGRTALIGDAAHAIHPIAGQGINLGFRDVAVLAELIAIQKEQGGDIASAQVMQAYAKWRRLDTLAMAGVTDGINRLFSNDVPPIKLVRGLGLFAVSKLPALKKLLMRHAMGVSGDLPALMKG